MSSWEMQLVETAEEELQILQTQYPNRFAYLKSDLQSFISHLREDHAPPRASSSVVLTQESTNCKKKQKYRKRKYIMENTGTQASSSSSSSSSSSTGKIQKNKNNNKVTKTKDRVEMVLERAQLCLQKIREVKASLC